MDRSVPHLMLRRNNYLTCVTARPSRGAVLTGPPNVLNLFAALQNAPRGLALVQKQKQGEIMAAQSIIIWLIVGAIAGWLAGMVVKGGGFGLIGDIVVGIIGAVIAGWLLPQIGIVIGGGLVGAIINAFIGAVILLVILRLIKR